jgi:SAM-dependent methyltransferase
MKELLLGCGSNREKKLYVEGRTSWSALTTLDFSDAHKPDVVHDMAQLPLPFADDSFDEIHAYDVLEHMGQQGDFRFFFDQWSDFWRILRPGGRFLGVSPHRSSPWAWGDPGHTRIICPESFLFLHQPAYADVGKTPMTDYRFCYKADYDLEFSNIAVDQQHRFVLRAVKPSRWSPQ